MRRIRRKYSDYLDSYPEQPTRRIVRDRAYRMIYDAAYHDGLFAGMFTTLLMPSLKEIAAVAFSGIKSEIAMSLTRQLVQYGRELVASRGKDESYTEAIIRKIKITFEQLLRQLKFEKSSLYYELAPKYEKIKRLS